MEKFVAKQNAKRLRKLLEQESDPGKRDLMARLLAEEEAKLAGLPAEDELGEREA